jgi:hypothetical protein
LLPFTGSLSGPQVFVAFVALAGGSAFTALARRRR